MREDWENLAKPRLRGFGGIKAFGLFVSQNIVFLVVCAIIDSERGWLEKRPDGCLPYKMG